jgi:hypothetical protein
MADADDALPTKYLLCIEIITPKLVWNRSVISYRKPAATELSYYYQTLLGLEDAEVTLHTESIPDDFNETLLTILTKPPTAYPVHDLETDAVNGEKREKYKTYIRQLCEMERARANLAVFVRPPAEDDGGDVTRMPSSRSYKRAWVRELLRSLNHDSEVAEAEHQICAAGEKHPLGWILTPTSREYRETRGSRIVISQEIGSMFAPLLGSDLYPDLVVSRLISTVGWAFQHVTSDALVKATLEWYMTAREAAMKDGISGWIHGLEHEMNELFSTFKRIRVSERFCAIPAAASDDKAVALKLVSTMEHQLLQSMAENPDISPLPIEYFRKYVNYLLREHKLPKDAAMDAILQRWVRSKLGFRAGVDPLLSTWKETWHLMMRGKPTAERVKMFIRTLESWDPVEAMTFTTPIKTEIASEWMHIYIENELMAEQKARVRSTQLHDRVKEWCFRFLPATVFPTSFTPMCIGPVFNRRGYVSQKRADGRYTMGIKYKHDEPTLSEITNDVDAQEDCAVDQNIVVPITETKTVAASKTEVDEKGGMRIEHFFMTTSSTQEIHLGTF